MSDRPAILITGAAVRLGRQLALGLADAGFDIALHFGQSSDDADTTANEIRQQGVACHVLQCDLSKTSQLGDLVTSALSALPNLTALINSASSYQAALISETTPELLQEQLQVNLAAPIELTRQFAAQVGKGSVINICDNKIAFNQFPYAAYLLSKKALAAFTQLAAQEFSPHVRVNGISPGVVLPAESRSKDYVDWRIEAIPLKKQGGPEHIVQAALYLLTNEFVTGEILTVDGGESGAFIGRHYESRPNES